MCQQIWFDTNIFLIIRHFFSLQNMKLSEGKIKSIVLLLVISGMIFLNSCDAARENPLDPNSNDNLLGTIEGTVQTFSLPYTPVKDVEVYWKPSNILVYTDAGGNFTIRNIKIENGPLIFRKAGYHTDTVQVDWAGERKVNEQINLNKLPALDSLSIYSITKYMVNPQSPVSELYIETKVTDVDNDIDTIFVINNELNLNKAMDFNIASKIFQAVLTPEDLKISDLEQAVGLEFDFQVRNVLGEVYQLKGGSLKRVIKNQVTGLLPSDEQLITTVPFDLSWKQFNHGYSYTYTIEIYTDEGNQQINEWDNISSQDTSFTVNSIEPGSYWWVIWVVDNFNNQNRSFPATFIVQ